MTASSRGPILGRQWNALCRYFGRHDAKRRQALSTTESQRPSMHFRHDCGFPSGNQTTLSFSQERSQQEKATKPDLPSQTAVQDMLCRVEISIPFIDCQSHILAGPKSPRFELATSFSPAYRISSLHATTYRVACLLYLTIQL